MAWDATWRPLFVAFLTGLALGDMKTGLIMEMCIRDSDYIERQNAANAVPPETEKE